MFFFGTAFLFYFIFKTNIVLEMKPATEKEPAMSNLENVFASLSILVTPVKVSFCTMLMILNLDKCQIKYLYSHNCQNMLLQLSK